MISLLLLVLPSTMSKQSSGPEGGLFYSRMPEKSSCLRDYPFKFEEKIGPSSKTESHSRDQTFHSWGNINGLTPETKKPDFFQNWGI
jgi:hypothetical protein